MSLDEIIYKITVVHVLQGRTTGSYYRVYDARTFPLQLLLLVTISKFQSLARPDKAYPTALRQAVPGFSAPDALGCIGTTGRHWICLVLPAIARDKDPLALELGKTFCAVTRQE